MLTINTFGLSIHNGGQTLYELYKKAYTPWKWFKKLKKVANDLGIIFLCSAFDQASVDLLEELDIRGDIIRQGNIGPVQQIHIEMPQEGYLRRDKDGNSLKPQPWRQQDYSIPTIYLDLGVHLHHLVHFLTGSAPSSVLATQKTFGNMTNVVDNAQCLVKYQNGMDVTMWVSKSAIGYCNGLKIRIFGKNGSAEWYQENPDELALAFADGTRSLIDRGNVIHEASLPRYQRFKAGHPTGFLGAFANLYGDIAETLNNDGEKKRIDSDFVFGIEHAIEGLLLFDAAKKSASAQSWKPLN